MGIRDRLKNIVKAQVRRKLGTFNVRTGEPAPPPASEPPPSPSRPAFLGDERPARRVVRAPIVADSPPPTPDDGPIRIKAQPSRDELECTFLADRPILERGSWYFPDASTAAGSPLAEALFAIEAVTSVLVDESTVSITRRGEGSWRPISEQVGAAMRACIASGAPAISAGIQASIPSSDDIRARIQQVIDDEINPGVAPHNGRISLSRLRGNSVYIEMGGGCQGCSAAAVTLRQGIHTTFRGAVPGVGAIYDETDHAAGLNPYFS